MDPSTPENTELVPLGEGTVLQARELERMLAEAGISTVLTRPEAKACCNGGGCGCGAKLAILVRGEDVPKVNQLLQAEWLDAVRREGTGASFAPVRTEELPEGSLQCPACGHVGPLVEGACGDCGLVLE